MNAGRHGEAPSLTELDENDNLVATLQAVFAAGVNFFDSADVYGWGENRGLTETIIGAHPQVHPAGELETAKKCEREMASLVFRDEGIQPLAHILDSGGADGVVGAAEGGPPIPGGPPMPPACIACIRCAAWARKHRQNKSK